MELITQGIITVLCSVMASSGLWAYLSKKDSKKDARDNMLMGLGHDRIQAMCRYYIDRGWISQEEYDDLYTYLYQPYVGLNGNGSAARDMAKVKLLPSQPPVKQEDENE